MNSLLDPVSKIIISVLALCLVLVGLRVREKRIAAWWLRMICRWLPRLVIIAAIVTLMAQAVHQRQKEVFIQPLDALFRDIISLGNNIQIWMSSHPSEIVRWILIAILLITIAVYLRSRHKSLSWITLLYAVVCGGLGWLWMGINQNTIGTVFLVIAGIYALYSQWARRKTSGTSEDLSSYNIFIALSLIILTAAWFRIYGINRIPFRFDYDEAIYGINAIGVLQGHHPTHFWESIAWRGLGHTNLSPVYIYTLSGYFLFFGANLVALKLLPITCGLLSILLTYFIGKTLFNKRLGLIGAFFLTVSPIAINLSRCGLLLISTQTVGLLVIYLMLRAIRFRDRRAYFFLGFVLAFAGYMYSPIKQLMMVTGFILIIHILFKRGFLVRHFTGIVIMTATILVTGILFHIPVLDLIYPKIVDYESVWHRTSTHLYTPQADYIRAIPLIGENFHKLLVSLFIRPHFNYDPWPQGNLYLNPTLAILSLVGLIMAVGNVKKSNYRLLLFLLAVFVLPNLLSRPPVMTRRLLYFMPFLYLVAAVPISSLWEESRQIAPVWGKRLFPFFVIVFCIVLAAFNAHIYFNSREHSGRWESERFFDEGIKKLLGEYYVFVYPYWISYSPTTINFLCYEKVTPEKQSQYCSYIKPEEVNGLLKSLPPEPIAFVLHPDSKGRAAAQLISETFPQTTIEEIKDTFGHTQGLVCRIDYPLQDRE